MKRSKQELDLLARKKLRRGYPAGELKNELLAEGYSENEIDSAFFNSIHRSKIPLKENAGKYPFWFFLSVGFLILGISIKAVNDIWLEPLSYPLIISGIVGIIAKYFFKLGEKTNTK